MQLSSNASAPYSILQLTWIAAHAQGSLAPALTPALTLSSHDVFYPFQYPHMMSSIHFKHHCLGARAGLKVCVTQSMLVCVGVCDTRVCRVCRVCRACDICFTCACITSFESGERGHRQRRGRASPSGQGLAF